jgi:chromatin segregation and condensation protein Rec8/ScpA/Scc1 (kleisin family)
LELVRRGRLSARQERLFDEIWLVLADASVGRLASGATPHIAGQPPALEAQP